MVLRTPVSAIRARCTRSFSKAVDVNAPAYALALAPDGKLVVASGEFSGDNKFLARYEP
jgi:hypothetical protein